MREQRRPDQLTWPQLRQVLLAALLITDGLVVAALAIARPDGWIPPFVAFGIVLIGLIGIFAWARSHRLDR